MYDTVSSMGSIDKLGVGAQVKCKPKSHLEKWVGVRSVIGVGWGGGGLWVSCILLDIPIFTFWLIPHNLPQSIKSTLTDVMQLDSRY